MNFFDANVIYGIPSQKRLYPVIPDRAALQRKLKEFGIQKAIVHREEQFFAHPHTANQMLAEDLRDAPELFGLWTLLPPHCHEMTEPEDMLAEMRKNRIVGWQFFPQQNGYIFHWRVLKVWFEMAEKHRLPLFINFSFVTEHDLLDVLDRYPNLTVILRNASVWPPDRVIRPFLTEFPRTHLELSNYLTADGVDALVACGYRDRLLYSSGFQTAHVGGPMMLVKQAAIGDVDQQQIAAGNLERILGEINYV